MEFVEASTSSSPDCAGTDQSRCPSSPVTVNTYEDPAADAASSPAKSARATTAVRKLEAFDPAFLEVADRPGMERQRGPPRRTGWGDVRCLLVDRGPAGAPFG